MAITAVANYDALVLDYTIDPVGSSVSGVPTSYVIAGTLPIRINGGASADMSTSPTTVSVNAFGAAAAGIVPLSGGGTTNFLRADGTWTTYQLFGAAQSGIVPQTGGVGAGFYLDATGAWVAGTVVGVSSITATLPLVASASTGAVTLSANTVGLAVGGIVPAIGTADSTKYLSATNPPTWTSPVLTGAVALQATTPGTPQTGHFNVTGTGKAGVLDAGATTPLGLVNAAGDGTTPGVVVSKFAGSVTPPKVRFQAARGTEGTPTFLNDGDGIGQVTGYPRIASAFNEQPWLSLFADGAGSGLLSYQPTCSDIIAGYTGAITTLRLGQTGARLVTNNSMGGSDRALSTFDLIGSLGLMMTAKTGNFTLDSLSTIYHVDCTAGNIAATLPAAASYTNRVYGILRIDDTINSLTVTGTINGVVNPQMSYTEFLLIQSDGTNWKMLDFRSRVPLTRGTASVSSAIVATNVKTAFDVNTTLPKMQSQYNTSKQTTVRIRASGTYSTHSSGTNSITFFIRDLTNGRDMLTSRLLTPANNLSSENWTVDGEVYITFSSNTRLLNGKAAMYDAAGDKTALMIQNTMVYSGSTDINVGLAVQWANSNAGNSIDMRQLILTVDTVPIF